MKGKILSIFFLLALFVPGTFAQDIILKTNGDELQVKVTEVNADDVKYKKFSNLAGPAYVILNTEIFMIKYENGDKDLFEKDPVTGKITIRQIVNPKPAQPQVQAQVQEKPADPPVSQEPKPASIVSPDPTDANGQYQLGLKYEKGDGVTQDNQKAADWYSKAAEQGHSEAQYRLGILCTTVKSLRITTKEDFQMRNGSFVNAAGLTMGPATALYWWKKAAAQGHAGAKAKVQEMEAANKPVAQNPPPPAPKSITGTGPVAMLKAKDGTYNVCIGEIGRDDKGNTTIELLGEGLGRFKIEGGAPLDFSPHLWMKMEAGGKIIKGANGNMSADKYVVVFETDKNPDKIIVYDNKTDNEEPSVVFDGKTKKILRGTPGVAPALAEKKYDARTGEHDIVDLIENKIVEVEVKGGDITYISMRIRRLADYPVNVKVPVGSYFISANTSAQNMVATAEKKIRLATDSWQSITIPAACANRPKDIPDNNDSFTVTRSSHQAELTTLMPVLDKANVGTTTKQAAVWIITDNASYSDLGILVSGYARAIGYTETARAMKICSDAGIDITKKRIWNDRQTILDNLQEGALKTWLKEFGQQ